MTDIESIIRRVVGEEFDRALAKTPAKSRPLITPTIASEQRSVGSVVGDEILAQLARRRQTQAWRTEQTGIPIATLSRRLTDSEGFRIGELRRIAAALEVDLREMLDLS